MKFKVGDRARVYGIVTNEGWFQSVTGTIMQIQTNPPRIWIDSIDALEATIVPQQCRRLVKKPRRRLWIAEQDYKLNTWPNASKNPPSDRPELFIEFVEVKKKK